jgi:tetratricopeptide (TPR) repeat protein
MGTRCLGWLTATLLAAGVAYADPKGDADKAAKTAMESYDLMDYDAAKKSLEKAIATATKAKLDKDPVSAKLHIYLGITTFAGGDAEGAKRAFTTAVKIDPKIQIEAAYKSPELTKLLDAARSDVTGSTGPGPGPVAPTDGVDCASVKGLQFQEPDGGKGGVAQAIEAYLAADVTAARVVVAYRSEGATDFTEVKLIKSGNCKYAGAIPSTSILVMRSMAWDAHKYVTQ